MAKTPGQRYTVAQFEAAIRGSGGIIATIARRVGCDWHTASKRINESATLRQLFEDESATIDDLAESVVISAMQEKDLKAAMWWLERRRRGKYATRQELTGAEGAAMEQVIRFEWVDDGSDNPDAATA